MPEIDRFEATQAIREQEQVNGQRFPIITLTANAIQGDKQCCLKSGMDRCFSRPIQVEFLLEAFEELVPNAVRCRPRAQGSGSKFRHEEP